MINQQHVAEGGPGVAIVQQLNHQFMGDRRRCAWGSTVRVVGHRTGALVAAPAHRQ